MMNSTRVVRTALRAGAVLATTAVVAYVLVPQIASVRLSVLMRINPGYLLVGIGLQAGFLMSYACLTRSVLPQPATLRLGTVARINLATQAVSHLVPGGTAAGTALGYRLLRRSGIRGSDACFALGTQGLGSAVVLNVILWLTLVVSIPLRGFDPRYITAAAIGAVLIGGCLGLVVVLSRSRQRAPKALRRLPRWLPFLRGDSLKGAVHHLAERLDHMRADRRLMARAFGWAAAAWLLNAVSLGVFIAAFGHRVSPDGLLIAFGLANVLAAIPITPRGLGVVEAVLIPTLIGFGTPPPSAILGVISYRLISFWVPIPVGAVAYLSLRRMQGWTKPARGTSPLRGNEASQLPPSRPHRPLHPATAAADGDRLVLESSRSR